MRYAIAIEIDVTPIEGTKMAAAFERGEAEEWVQLYFSGRSSPVRILGVREVVDEEQQHERVTT